MLVSVSFIARLCGGGGGNVNVTENQSGSAGICNLVKAVKINKAVLLLNRQRVDNYKRV